MPIHPKRRIWSEFRQDLATGAAWRSAGIFKAG